MVTFNVVIGRDDMVCNSGGVTILCKSFEMLNPNPNPNPSAITGWNSLDVNVRNSVSLPTFKAKLRSTLFPHCYNKLFDFSFLGVHLLITPV